MADHVMSRVHGRRPGSGAWAENGGPTAPLVVSSRRKDGWWIADVAGELDLATEPVLRDCLIDLLTDHDRPTRVIVDLTDLTFCDPRGLGVLVGLHTQARQQGDDLRLVCPEGRVRRFFRLAGFTHALPLFTTLSDALAADGTA